MPKECFGTTAVPLSPAVRAGSGREEVVKTAVWLGDRDDDPACVAACRAFFSEHPPARSTAEARLTIDPALEIAAIAGKPA